MRARVWGGSCDVFEACNVVMSMSPRNRYTGSCNSGDGSGGVQVSCLLIYLPCLVLPANVSVYDVEYIYALTHTCLVAHANPTKHTHDITHTHTHTHTTRTHTQTHTHTHTHVHKSTHTRTHIHVYTHIGRFEVYIFIYMNICI